MESFVVATSMVQALNQRGRMIRHGETTLSFVTVRRTFGFRSIEIGRWVTEAERDRAAIQFYRAFTDLMTVLRGPAELISLRQQLGLQYGIGGRPGVSAHYNPGSRKLALAKNAGPGSLAHEWFHAFDHYLANKAFPLSGPRQFASAAWLDKLPITKHPLNDRLVRCFQSILLNEDGTHPSDLLHHSLQADRALRTAYYAQPEELCARAFEGFVEDALPHNQFLVRGTRSSDEAKQGLYPLGRQRERINQAFNDYFQALGRALYRQQEQTG